MRVIVVGAGEVGSSIAENLSSKNDVVVVDIDDERTEALNYSLDVLAIQGDGGNIETLEEAGIEKTDMLIASTDDDETNIVTCGTGAVYPDVFTIARVKHPQYLRTWEHGERVFDIDFMVSSALETARTIGGVIGLSTAKDVDMFANGLVQMTDFDIPADSPVAGQTVEEADRFEELTFAAVIRDDEIVIARGDTVLSGGDNVVVIGSPESTRAFSAAIAPTQDGADDIVIVGGSEIGLQTAILLEERGYRPRLIEHDAERARQLAETLQKTRVLESDGTDKEFLEQKNIGSADTFIATLENDQQNLLATLLAKQLGTDRTIAVVDTGEFADLFETVGVDVAISPKAATAEEITRFTRGRHAENVAIIEDDRAEVLEFQIEPNGIPGQTVREIVDDLPDGIVIGAISRAGTLITPRGDTVIEVGDHVIVLADAAVAAAVSDRL